MELLIPGLILVGFMVWASTRIKRNASAAFDAETIDTDEFSIRKPEGFLHVLNDNSGLAFRSYSKEFGKVGKRDLRRATIEIEKHPGTDLQALKKDIKDQAESIASSEAYSDGGEKAAWMRSTQIIDGGEFDVVRKIVTRGSSVWEARGSVLAENREEHFEILEAALESIQVK